MHFQFNVGATLGREASQPAIPDDSRYIRSEAFREAAGHAPKDASGQVMTSLKDIITEAQKIEAYIKTGE